MISERTLKQWRRDSLTIDYNPINPDLISYERLIELHQRILRLTQELMDWHLIKKQL